MHGQIRKIPRDTGVILDIGATPLPDGSTRFRVWGPRAQKIEVIIPGSDRTPALLNPEGNGYFSGTVSGIGEGDRYRYLLDDTHERPDPASRFQPEGVHGPSQIVDPNSYQWNDKGWRGIPLEEYIFYELHVGTFTPHGTFDGVISRLDYLVELGITAVELMPVGQFPGERNWGYDGTYPFAPQNSYGGPDGLKRLVDACHARGLAVTLDVVYNHLGPEGNYLHGFGPYFTDRYRTPWGDAVNYDGPDSDAVRSYFISNSLYWITEFHIDALRLDAIHGIYDFSARHILQELVEAAHLQGKVLRRRAYLIAESDLNDVRAINPPATGGHGLDAQWNEDFHHALRALLTGDRAGYYADFGLFSDVVKSFEEGFVLSGSYSSYRRRRHGSSSTGITPDRLAVFSRTMTRWATGCAGSGRESTSRCSSSSLPPQRCCSPPICRCSSWGRNMRRPLRFPILSVMAMTDWWRRSGVAAWRSSPPLAIRGAPPIHSRRKPSFRQSWTRSSVFWATSAPSSTSTAN